MRKPGELIMAHFPMAEIHSIQNTGHWLRTENPEDFYKESLYFLLNE